MYTRRLKYRSQNWASLFRQSDYLFRQAAAAALSISRVSSATITSSRTRNGVLDKLCVHPAPALSGCGRGLGIFRRTPEKYLLTVSSRFFSAEGDGSNAAEGKHVPVKEAASFDKGKPRKEEVETCAKNSDEHARLGEQDQKEWLNNERLSFESRTKESPFLPKRERFKQEFLRRVVPWEKITVSWNSFPYHVSENAKEVLVECVASHLKHKEFASKYGARLSSSAGRILLRSIPGTELYRERLVKALAHDLQVPLLVLDSSALAPYDFGQECASESESDDENAESGEECTSESEAEGANDVSNEEEWASSNDAKSSESDDEDPKAVDIKKIVPCSLEEFARRVSEAESTSASAEADDDEESSDQSKRPLRKGDRVKYIGASVHVEVDNRLLQGQGELWRLLLGGIGLNCMPTRIILGKIPTSEGSTNAYTFLSGRPIANGQRGEVYEVNGDQVAVILDTVGTTTEEGNTEINAKEPDGKPSVYWIDIQDIVHDLDTQAEDWCMAMDALCEVLPSLQPIVVYIPDSTEWLSRAVPKSSRKDFIRKVEEMFDQLPGPIVLICGQNLQQAGPKEKEKYTMVLPHLGRLAKLPLPLKHLTEGLRPSKLSKENDICKLFCNVLTVHPPKQEELLRIFNKQIDDDRRIIISRSNLIELHKVLEDHELYCMDLLNVKTDGIILTKQKAEKVVGWARNHYLSSIGQPSVKSGRLVIHRESLDIAVLRLKEQETISRKHSQNLKTLAKDEYESNFVSAVTSPDEIGVKFDDIGALEDVKRTLNELVTLPMRRPELFSHGNLLRPCKGVLLFGPPGTGKTLLAKALATEAGANFISITGSTLTSKWFGDAEKLTKALFSFATRLAPVIIFVDEVDSLLGARGGAFEHEATRRMRNEFMAAWDGMRSKDSQRILILGATNRPFDLDDAVIRRMPRRIYIDLPDAQNRMKILSILLSQENLDTGFSLSELASATEGYSGSDLKNLCIAAAYRPVQELLEEETKGSLLNMTPLLRPLKLDDFIQAKAKVGASVAYDAASMNELRKWNEQYGEGGSRRRSPFGFGN